MCFVGVVYEGFDDFGYVDFVVVWMLVVIIGDYGD